MADEEKQGEEKGEKKLTSPFVNVELACPICGKKVYNRYVKSRLYKPLEVENDHHVKGYKWNNPEFEHIRPQDYYIWFCPHCFYADTVETFRGDVDPKISKIELLKSKVMILSKQDDGISTRLSKTIDLSPETPSYNSVLNAHLLAAYLQQLIKPNSRNYQKLGNVSLRTAWLFREAKEGLINDRGYVVEGYRSNDMFLVAIRKSLKEDGNDTDFPINEEDAMRTAIKYFKRNYDTAIYTDEGRTEIEVLFLLSELHTRLEEYNEAQGYLNTIFKTAVDKRAIAKKALESALNRKDVAANIIERMKSRVTWLNNYIDKIGDARDHLQYLVYQRDRPRIMAVVDTIRGEKTASNVYHAVRQKGFSEYCCRKAVEELFESGTIKTPQKQKRQKGLLARILEFFGFRIE